MRTRFLSGILALAATVVGGRTSEAAECRPPLRYSFQPDCYRSSLEAPCGPRKTGTRAGDARLDLGPQIAVWVESANGETFVDTLMVTRLTASFGLGNRPGHWSLPSSPKFPYGKRPMALPVWAFKRGRLYDTVVMQDAPDKERWLGFHEAYSSPDPYYCRPMTFLEIDVDAITCPTATFNSAKGRLSPTEPKSYYPPRNDLVRFTPLDCDQPTSGGCSAEKTSAQRYAAINDLDAVAAPTPAYGDRFTGRWYVPPELPDGEYALFVEISKEWDNNEFHGVPARPDYQAYQDPNLAESGLRNNFGQPSVVFKVPLRVDSAVPYQNAVTDMHGYGSWNGATGALNPKDGTISDKPGSGMGRLLVVSEPSISGGDPVVGRVHVMSEPQKKCGGTGEANGRIEGLTIPPESISPTEVEVRFVETSDGGGPVEEYEIRYQEGTMTAESFPNGTPAATVTPSAPGMPVSFRVTGLKSEKDYTVGVRAKGCCLGSGPIAFATFRTTVLKFKQLSGCFVATAAYGSPLEREVGALRRFRDDVLRQSAIGSALIGLYERSSPPLAATLRQSDAVRAVVRAALTPVVQIVDRAQKVHNSRLTSGTRPL